MSPLLQHAIAFTLGCYAVASLMVLGLDFLLTALMFSF